MSWPHRGSPWCRGGQFLKGRIAPNGPILRECNLSYVHKSTWGMYAAGVEHGTIAKLLDWADREARRETGDFYLPGEPPEYKDFQRVTAWPSRPGAIMPNSTSRRTFLKAASASAAALSFTASSYARVVGANDRISIGVIGCGV